MGCSDNAWLRRQMEWLHLPKFLSGRTGRPSHSASGGAGNEVERRRAHVCGSASFIELCMWFKPFVSFDFCDAPRVLIFHLVGVYRLRPRPRRSSVVCFGACLNFLLESTSIGSDVDGSVRCCHARVRLYRVLLLVRQVSQHHSSSGSSS